MCSSPTDDGERGGETRTANGSDPWALCTNSQARRFSRRRGPMRPVRTETGTSAQQADHPPLRGCTVGIPGLCAECGRSFAEPSPRGSHTSTQSCSGTAFPFGARHHFRCWSRNSSQGAPSQTIGRESTACVRGGRVGAPRSDRCGFPKLWPGNRTDFRSGPGSRRCNRESPVRGNNGRRGMGLAECGSVGFFHHGLHAVDRSARRAERCL
jgi:hypothetical protein